MGKLSDSCLSAVDNGPRKGLEKFLKAASDDPDTVLHYEFMQDYKVHLKHLDGRNEEVGFRFLAYLPVEHTGESTI